MDLQSLFYTVAIIYMIVGILVLFGILFFLWSIQRKMQELKQNTVDRVMSFVQSRRTEFLSSAAMGVAAIVINRIRKIFKRD